MSILAALFGREESGLSSAQKLQVREEVTRQLMDLPAGTLKLIQDEVCSRVKEAEHRYRQLATVFCLCFGLIAALIGVIAQVLIGGSWKDLRKRTEEVIRRGSDIETVQSNLAARFVEMTNFYGAA